MQSSQPAALYLSIYSVAIMLTLSLLLCTAMFWMTSMTSINDSQIVASGFFPWLSFLSVPVIFFYPGLQFHKAGRFRFLRFVTISRGGLKLDTNDQNRTFRRISVGGLDRESRFSDVITADALTSYTKVLGDIWVMFCMFLSGRSVAGAPVRTCGGKFFVPTVLCIPYAIRLRQCLTDYVRTPTQGRSIHLLNAIKYSTAFPVVLLSTLQRTSDEPDVFFSSSSLYRLW